MCISLPLLLTLTIPTPAILSLAWTFLRSYWNLLHEVKTPTSKMGSWHKQSALFSSRIRNKLQRNGLPANGAPNDFSEVLIEMIRLAEVCQMNSV